MAIRLSEIERAYFVRKLGGTQPPTKSLTQIKREYFVSFTGTAIPQVSLNELTIRWMIKVLGNAGITPSNSNSEADLWKQMVLSISKTPVRQTDQNKITFYLNAP
jgi:hypothetical protein